MKYILISMSKIYYYVCIILYAPECAEKEKEES